MKKILTLVILWISSSSLFAQNTNEIIVGSGLATTFNKSTNGYNGWVQFNMALSKNASIALEYEHLSVKELNAYVPNPSKNPTQKTSDNNISILYKYNVCNFLKWKGNIDISTGITYTIRIIEYKDTYIFPGVSGEITSTNTVGGSNFGVPFSVGGFYKINQFLKLGIRAKATITPKLSNTYTTSVGISYIL